MATTMSVSVGICDRLVGKDDEERDHVRMDRIRAGCEDSLRDLIKEYWRPLVVYALRYVGGWDEAEDVVQKTFLRIWRSRSDWRHSGSVRGYLFLLTHNLALNACRDAKVRRSAEGHLARNRRNLQAASPDPHLDLEGHILEEQVLSAIAALSPCRREALLLCCFEGMTHREAAASRGVSTQTIANQISVALSELRQSITATV